jgi:hypothetical protein
MGYNVTGVNGKTENPTLLQTIHTLFERLNLDYKYFFRQFEN